jgi:hypothetical protein
MPFFVALHFTTREKKEVTISELPPEKDTRKTFSV